ncbi:carbohydrate ABC transporter permease [Vallitalea okinawensis]|uniref:carbohydrate ABC transporter permease n=1 Tax=Vallitalea okinawensis TaxID=2078660 RepID=UPI000CFB4C32|nr:carbohydrate ABC transporter permease [Vallitalea okinawensis]
MVSFKLKKTKYYGLSKGELIFGYIVNILMVIAIIGALYPLLYVLSASLSSGIAVDRKQVFLLPVDLTFSAYEYLFSDRALWVSLANSFFYMFAGTAYCMVISVMVAYVMSRKNFLFNRFLNFFVLFTMWLGAGTIPRYLNYINLGMGDSRLGMIVGFGISAFNIILIRNYFDSLPKELVEAATIDGASESQVLTKIFVPLSSPILATVSLFYALSSWNSWFWYSLLIKTESKQPIQIILRRLLLYTAENIDDTSNEIIKIEAGGHNDTTLKYAIMVLSLIPVVIVYPYVQRHFTKGITLGGVKS